MNKWNFAIIGIFALLAATVGMLNILDSRNDSVMKGWQNVETAYFQRIELLDQYISHARGKVGNSAELKALSESFKAAKTCAPCFSANPDEIKAFREKQEELTAAVAKLVASVNIYPKLMSDPAFRALHAKLDEIESRITTLTETYNRTNHENSLNRQRPAYKLASLLLPGKKQSSSTNIEKEAVVIVLNSAPKLPAEANVKSQLDTVAAN